MHPLNWLIVIGWLTYVVIHGIRRSKGTDNIEGYLLANKDALEVQNAYTYFDIGRAFTVIYLKPKEQRTKKARIARIENGGLRIAV